MLNFVKLLNYVNYVDAKFAKRISCHKQCPRRAVLNTVTLFNRKQTAAQEHHRMTLQKKYFTAWQLYLTQTQQLSIIEERRKLTENKMASFLDAAATGKLWSRRNDGADLRRSRSFEAVNQSKDSTNMRVVSVTPVRSVLNSNVCLDNGYQ